MNSYKHRDGYHPHQGLASSHFYVLAVSTEEVGVGEVEVNMCAEGQNKHIMQLLFLNLKSRAESTRWELYFVA